MKITVKMNMTIYALSEGNCTPQEREEGNTKKAKWLLSWFKVIVNQISALIRKLCKGLVLSNMQNFADLQISPDLPVQQKKSGRLYIQVVGCSVVHCLLYAEILQTRTEQTRPDFFTVDSTQ